MKKHFLPIAIMLFTSTIVLSQNTEFKTYKNGLIYSEHAMKNLGFVVDSLNLAYESCNFDKQFYGKQQTIGHVISLEKGATKMAKKDLKKNISLTAFLKKYPQATIKKNQLILKLKYLDNKNKEKVAFDEFSLDTRYGLKIEKNISFNTKDLKNKWVFQYNKWDDSLDAFYFPNEFKTTALPKKYNTMIGYADCLIDTTTTKLKKDLKREYGYMELSEDWTSYSHKKKTALLDKFRGLRVVGSCSMDSSPRVHALNIALLSAETYNWRIFFKAHLDIMNDRFDRASDGSYAQEGRKTYIKELEELNINVMDLIMGISFQVENPAINHYNGNIWRIGRALAETKNRKKVEQRILEVIGNKELDDYNRLIFYFLLRSYYYNSNNNYTKEKLKQLMVTSIQLLPKQYQEVLLKK
ncbi:hypothetical protein [uncultured Tenacibaculum sp.]|uniref:hypothetical protein n=1 Tax=uncultured Tenacibaculum sp. TaxID=174713 RepID=UPI00262152FF|nr:hypothetical protein [uncultured Tenacibaculum sp.]